jgi:hypothetical protein
MGELLETLFLVSLETEEGAAITLHLAYMDPDNPDPEPPPYIRPTRWSCVRFGERIPLTIASLSKLARASDPRTSSFAVFSESQNLFIWGLVDQGNEYYDFVNFESESGFERPGWFQVSVTGVGRLTASIGFDTVAEVRLGTLRTRGVDALRLGPLRSGIQPGIDRLLQRVEEKLERQYRREFVRERGEIGEVWIETLCRLLLRAQSYKHGGALIIADGATSDLQIKYALDYPRLTDALIEKACRQVEDRVTSDEILALMEEDMDEVPMGLYVDNSVANDEMDERRSEIDSAIWFISLLTRVDGAVLLDRDFRVSGFGVEIQTREDPEGLFRATTPHATRRSLTRDDPRRFGTRHRSMMRYCAGHPGAVGIVISQDGDVRALTTVGEALVMWENLRLQLPEFVRRRRAGLPYERAGRFPAPDR